ncbi:hypothetical protein PYW08_005795 [Mythimna loreyi]|uniref:Uncharacterized protein n=1 Tax=Mythimna loreyi TaxID=667449 RepID=A0ACC2QJN9_9NEOP|nr:hypothetical protein PYW08_005795 [Mythimna loreyi]
MSKKMPEIQLEEVRRFMEDCLKAVGAPESEAQAHADLLMHADTVGHYSHGLNRLEFYINDIRNGACEPNKTPEILKDVGATAWVDGHDALGATVGNFCMKLAIQKAKEFGVGWVAAKRCNHFGMAGYWALLAEREGLIGMAFTNTSPIMVPTRATQSALGTNPIGVAAPATGGDKLVVDMATTSVAMGKIECQIHKEEPLPPGWALGPDGKPTTDAKAAFTAGKLMPLGGEEKTSGYKGYALAAMVEVFTSGLSGSYMTHNIRGWETDSLQGPPNLGQCFAAINPEFFAPGFKDRVADCLNTWRNLEAADPSLPVLAPGDKEHKIGGSTLAKGTVNYPPNQVEAMNNLAKRIGTDHFSYLQQNS